MDFEVKSAAGKNMGRNSGIDLLKIIAICLICFSHANYSLKGIIQFPALSIDGIITTFVTPFGKIGNLLFVICSSFFLADKKRVGGGYKSVKSPFRFEPDFNMLFSGLFNYSTSA